nr:hypothetical protein F54E7.4 - Caenorhabditis elegans [Caenorhabditis elegans]
MQFNFFLCHDYCRHHHHPPAKAPFTNNERFGVVAHKSTEQGQSAKRGETVLFMHTSTQIVSRSIGPMSLIDIKLRYERRWQYLACSFFFDKRQLKISFLSIIMSASSTSSSSTSCPEGGEPSGSCKSSDEGESTLKKRMQQYGIASGYANSSISTLDRSQYQSLPLNGTRRVTVQFGRMKIVVPWKESDQTVGQLADAALLRYKKARGMVIFFLQKFAEKRSFWRQKSVSQIFP